MKVNLDTDVKKVVYFVRHGQSEDNVAPVFQAEDSPLSKVGLQQASFIAKRVAALEFDKLISSPLTRTKQTAELISKATKQPIAYSDLFVERIKPESINGKPYTDPQANKTWRQWEKSIVNAEKKVENGENYEELISRADKALEYLLKQPEDRLVVVTHGYFLRTLVARVVLGDTLSPASFSNFQKVVGMENTGVTVILHSSSFEMEPCWRLWVYNDHAHLAE